MGATLTFRYLDLLDDHLLVDEILGRVPRSGGRLAPRATAPRADPVPLRGPGRGRGPRGHRVPFKKTRKLGQRDRRSLKHDSALSSGNSRCQVTSPAPPQNTTRRKHLCRGSKTKKRCMRVPLEESNYPLRKGPRKHHGSFGRFENPPRRASTKAASSSLRGQVNANLNAAASRAYET